MALTKEEIEARRARFNNSAKVREAEKKANSYGDFGNVEIPKFECEVLKPNTSHIIRLIGNAPEMADKDSDPVIIQKSVCKGDNGFINVIWSDDPNHPMNQLKNTILGKYKWDKENNARIYDNRNLASFKAFMYNGKDPSECSPYEKGMTPVKYVLFNCISRNDDWCKENKHTKVLCWNVAEKEVEGETRSYPDYGIKNGLFSEIFDVKCTMLKRHFEDTDLVIRRFDKKTKVGDNYYVVSAPEEKSTIKNFLEKDKMSDEKIDEFISKLNDDYLSHEEESYERYNLKNIPFISAPTPVAVCLKAFDSLIKLTDKEHGTNLRQLFVEWKDKELEELKKKNEENGNAEENSSVGVPTESVEEVAENEVAESELPSEIEEETVAPTPTVKSPTVKKIMKTTTFNVDSLLNIFPNIANMKAEDKALIVGYDDNEGCLKYKEGVDIATCPVCDENGTYSDIPDAWSMCPYCGTSFE